MLKTVHQDWLSNVRGDLLAGTVVALALIPVMGAYGHSRIRHLIVGSTTTAMIRTCLIPVLLLR